MQTILSVLDLNRIKRSDIIITVVTVVLSVIIVFIPTGFEKASESAPKGKGIKAEVLETDNSEVLTYGIVKQGDQGLFLRIKNGVHKGEEVWANNLLYGKMELDKIFEKGDMAYAVIQERDGKISSINVVDHYRIGFEAILLVLFCLLLLVFAGFTGLKALISFAFSGLVLWKILLPGFLKGLPPIPFTLVIVLILTAVIIFLIGGTNRKGSVAFLGAASGILLTAFLSVVFGKFFQINGAIRPFSETLLYTGFPKLSLSDIFLSGIFLCASGAVMDLAMDVSASMYELSQKRPDLSVKELTLSGLSVSRAVIGTMTTTLLLAYSGASSTMLMVFIAQGVPINNVLNLKYVSAEILQTLVGSFGLVSVAPLTAIIGGLIFGLLNSPKTNA